MPEIAGNLRLDQPWGAVQLSAAAHQVDASLFGDPALTTPPTTYAFPALTSNSYGFAVRGGLKLNADYISPGDKLMRCRRGINGRATLHEAAGVRGGKAAGQKHFPKAD